MNFDSLYNLVMEREKGAPVRFEPLPGYDSLVDDQPPGPNHWQDSRSTKAPGEQYTRVQTSVPKPIERGAKNVRDFYRHGVQPFIDDPGGALKNQLDVGGMVDQFATAAGDIGSDVANATGLTDLVKARGSLDWRNRAKGWEDRGFVKPAWNAAKEFMADDDATFGGAIGKSVHEPAGLTTALAGGGIKHLISKGRKLPPPVGPALDKTKKHLDANKWDEVAQGLPLTQHALKAGKEATGHATSGAEEENQSQPSKL